MTEVVVGRKTAKPRLSGENKDKSDMKIDKSAMLSNLDLIKMDSKATKQGKKIEIFSLSHDAVIPTSIDKVRPFFIPSTVSSRSVSPFSRKSSPPRSATPVPTTSGLSFSKNIGDGMKKTNEILSDELHKLHLQVESLTNRCELQELELQKSVKKVREVMTLAAEESAKCKAAKEVIKSLTAQLKDMAEKLPAGSYDPESLKLNSTTESNDASDFKSGSVPSNGKQERLESVLHSAANAFPVGLSTSNGRNNCLDGASTQDNSKSGITQNSASQVETEWMEQYESGVYITLVAFRDGTRDLKRVRFSRRRFVERQAETWWSENRDKVYDRYNVRVIDKSSASSQPAQIS